jgi:Lon protease-like protein
MTVFSISVSCVGMIDAFTLMTTSGGRYISTPTAPSTTHTPTTSLFGISEWRDLMFDFPGTGQDRRLGKETSGPPKEICILPFPYAEVLLQGEQKQLRLYEDRFIKLFDYCLEKHEGVVAMGLLADTGIIQTVPLCEIEAYNRMDEFGIFVTIRVVGRAQLVDILQQAPYLKAVCRELNDSIPPNLELPNLLASNIENYILLLNSMEHQLAAAPEKETEDEASEEAAEMKRRIQAARLVSFCGVICRAIFFTMEVVRHGFLTLCH